MKHGQFLKDVTFLAFTAYGGPQAHVALMLDMLVEKRQYLTEEELIELNALCQILPGPTSTQTITSIGYKIGGPALALITLSIWVLPAVAIMTVLSFMYAVLQQHDITTDFLKFIGPLAVGFITVAAYKIGKKVVTDWQTIILFACSAILACFFRQPWVFPLILLGGGLITVLSSKASIKKESVNVKPNWKLLLLFVALLLAAEALLLVTNTRHAILFESFYRYGSLIFGGGQVLIPFMQADLVATKQFLTNDEFLTGYGLVQGLPGPIFSFSAYAGGMSMSGTGILSQVAGSLISAVAIFLPGTLLIFFVYPIWETIKKLSIIKLALKGVNATAAGLIAAASFILFQSIGFSVVNSAIIVLVFAILVYTKLPAPLLVLLALAAGVASII